MTSHRRVKDYSYDPDEFDDYDDDDDYGEGGDGKLSSTHGSVAC